jgi:cell division GTPase FtsZ
MMMLNAKIIGIGAAGNKAAIELMKEVPELQSSIMLVNTTLKDIPLEYRDFAVELEGLYKGCAKERSIANDIMIDNLKNNKFEYPYNENDAMTIIVTSAEGGTGSGASIMLAKYISAVYKSHIHFCIFTGFEDDVRGLKNTVDLLKELDPNYTVEIISNKKFLDEAYDNRVKAEELANKKFCENIKVLLGGTITESKQNIDESDLLKLVNTPGFMVIESANLNKIKNTDDYNKRLIDAIDNSKSLTIEPTCKRFGIILDITDKESYFVDFSNKILKERYGVPYEAFSHIQNIHEDNNIQIIVSGLKMPVEDIEDVYNEFISKKASVDVSKDDFFSKAFSTDANEFDTLNKSVKKNNIDSAKADFFNSLGTNPTVIGSDNGTFKKVKKFVVSNEI